MEFYTRWINSTLHYNLYFLVIAVYVPLVNKRVTLLARSRLQYKWPKKSNLNTVKRFIPRPLISYKHQAHIHGALSFRVAVLQMHFAPSWQTMCCIWHWGLFEAWMKASAGDGRGTSCLDFFFLFLSAVVSEQAVRPMRVWSAEKCQT